VIDKLILCVAVQELCDAIDAAKLTSLNTQIAKNTDRMSLYKIEDNYLLKKPTLKLPSHDSVLGLAERFSPFFTKKISEIRQQLEQEARYTASFMAFKEVTTGEIACLLRSCPAKVSARDPIPTVLVRKLAYVLAAPIVWLVNLSFSTDVFPDEMKLVLTLLKMPSLDPALLSMS
jgi:hypothetical protein